MRRMHFGWIIGVLGIFGTVYGTYLLIYHSNRGNGLNSTALILLIVGIVALFAFIVISVGSLYARRKNKANSYNDSGEENITVVVENSQESVENSTISEIEETKQTSIKKEYDYEHKNEKVYAPSTSSYSSTVYVKQVGYGPLLRINGDRILDMLTNTYYRIEGNLVKQEGYGPVLEIRGNQIKEAFGNYLYEISGNNINKVFGGFYASVSGNYITTYDLSLKYEMTDSLSKRQILVVAAMLFGKY